MKRDMDLIRSILLKIEEQADQDGASFHTGGGGPANEPPAVVAYHLALMVEGGLIQGRPIGKGTKEFEVTRITWKGHDFLDSVRDPKIWRATKNGAAKVGGFSVDLLGALAKGLIKKKIEEHTGVKIDL